MGKHKTATAVIILLGLAAYTLVLLVGNLPSQSRKLTPLKVTLPKVGKADAIAVQTDANIMVINAGVAKDSEELNAFLTNQGISYVDTLIITHFDRDHQDHIGGADTLVKSMEIGQVPLPAYPCSNTEYFDFMSALDQKGIHPQRLTQPVEFTLDGATVLVEPPLSYEAAEDTVEMDNNFSLITTVTHGKTVFCLPAMQKNSGFESGCREELLQPVAF